MKKLSFFIVIFFAFSLISATNIINSSENGLTSFSKLYEKAVQSVVLIKAMNDTKTDDQLAQKLRKGTGFIYTSDGYILTNNHIIKDANVFKIEFFDETICYADLIGFDERTDISVLKVDKKNLPNLNLSDEEIKIGDWVFAIGNPFSLQSSLSVGFVSGKNRFDILDEIEDLIQLDINLYPGSSGSPILNLNGEVIGMTKAGKKNFSGIAYIIPSEMIKKVSNRIINNKDFSNGRFGFNGIIKTDDNRFFIIEISYNSPVDKAGIKTFDQILEYNGIKITSVNSFFNYIKFLDMDEILNIKVLRNNEVLIFSLKKE